MKPLLPQAEPDMPALIGAGSAYTHEDLWRLSAPVAAAIEGRSRVALWAAASAETAVGVLAALRSGATLVPINPAAGPRDIEHVLRDCAPEAIIRGRGDRLPSQLESLPRVVVNLNAPDNAHLSFAEPASEAPALILYTSGTTGPPKGVVISRGAIAACLDGLARSWAWSKADVVAHALPLSHAHGLILGLVGPLRLGGGALLLERFSPAAVAAALDGPATMLFGVPTMYRRLRLAAEDDPGIASALSKARLLVSGSAALTAGEHAAIERLSGHRIVERYGMTETLITLAARFDEGEPGRVGYPLPGVEVRLVDEKGAPLSQAETDVPGELEIRSPTLFDGYLGLPEATEKAFHDGWFMTGDIVSRDRRGSFRILGRRGRDLIKTGGYRVGASEVEAVLFEHPSVEDVAVFGEPDDDLGQRIVALVVLRSGHRPESDELIDFVATELSRHKRPRIIRFVEAIPRNATGKVQRHRLGGVE